jgi:hypothetical protein
MERPNAIQNWSTDIVALTTKRVQLDMKNIAGIKVMGGGHKGHAIAQFFSAKEKGSREFWVAFVVERSMKRNVLDFKAVDERMCIVRIKTVFHNLHLISVHAATEGKGAKEKETFNQKMEEAYDICPSNDITVLLVDLNGKIRREEIYQDW